MSARPIFVSPHYFALLANACAAEKIDCVSFTDFGVFLNELKFSLQANCNTQILDQIVREEARLLTWGGR